MMLVCDGSEISMLTCALLISGKDGAFEVRASAVLPRVLGDELAVVQLFLADAGVEHALLSSIGLVCTGSSAGALRSTVSMLNAFAIARGIPVCAVQRIGVDTWVGTLADPYVPYVFPIYEKSAHVTPSRKDALGREVTV